MIITEGIPSLEYIRATCSLCECQFTTAISELEQIVTPIKLIREKLGKTEYDVIQKADRIKYKNIFKFTCPSCQKQFYMFKEDITGLGCDAKGEKLPKYIYEGKKYESK